MHLVDTERERDVKRLADRVSLLSAQIHSLTADLVDVVAEVESTRSWHGWGTRSLAHWLSIIGASTLGDAQRLSRVAHERERLGEIYEMATRGEVALPVLDAVARVITPENAHTIQNIVATCTASQTQRVLAKFRELQPEPADGEPIAPSGPDPDLWWRQWTDDLGRGRLDAAVSPLVAELLGEAFGAALPKQCSPTPAAMGSAGAVANPLRY